MNNDGVGGFYDATLDRYWVFGGSQLTDWDNLIEVNPTTFAATGHQVFDGTNTGNSCFTFIGNDPDHSYKRFLWMEDWRTLFVCPEVSSPVYAIKLPNA
jgi:hypothetical protein